MSQYDGSITLSTKVDTKGIKQGSNDIKSALSGLSGTLGKIGAAVGIAFSVGALVKFGKEAIGLASDLQEVQNVVDVAFGSMAWKMEEFANEAIETYGISKLTAKKTASTYMAMAKGMGIAENAASDMALELTGLSADMSSFYNVSQEMADIALKSVFTGETETLKQYGIVMTQVNLKEFARQQGITKSIDKMTQQEQVMLRYQYILKQTALAQGDFARTSDSWANQTRVLTERWKEMQSTFGEAFMTIGTLILPAVNTLIKGLTAVANMAKIAAVNIAALFGKKISTDTQSIASNTASMASDTGTAASNIGDVGKASKKAKKEANKLTAAFDELQILSANSADNVGAGGAGGVGALGNIEPYFEDAEGFDPMKYATEVNEALSFIMGIIGGALCAVGLLLIFSGNIPWGVGFIITGASLLGVSVAALSGENPTQNAQNALNALGGIIGGAMVAIGIMLIMLGSFPLGIGFIAVGAIALGVTLGKITALDTNKITSTIMYIQGIAAGALLALGVMLLVFTGANPLSLGLIITGAALLAITVAQIVAGQAESDTANMIYKITAIASVALLALGVILLFTPVSWGLALGLIAAGAVGLASTVALNWDKMKDNISEFFRNNSSSITTISIWLLVIGLMLVIAGVTLALGIGLIAVGAVGLATEAKLNWDNIKAKISEKITAIGDWCKTWGLLVLGIILVFSGAGIPLGLALMAKGGANLTEAQDPLWNTIVDKVKETWNNVQSYWKSNIAKYFTAEWWADLGKKAMNGLIAVIENAINGITSKINSIGFDLPDIMGGGHVGFNIPRLNIPRLAKGAVIPANREFLAVLGDQKQGVNIETPLDTMIQAFKTAIFETGGNGNQTVILELDGRELGRAVVKCGKEENRRVGTKLVFG